MVFRRIEIIRFLLRNKFSTCNYIAKEQRTGGHLLLDKFKRFHNYLRISLVERCNLRCLYCMPEDGVTLSPTSDLLTLNEICRLSHLFVKLGVTNIRFTGGEPLIRKDIIQIMENVNELRSEGLERILITTNGITLSRKLDQLIKAGLDGVNISLDTLQSEKFVKITRRKGLDKVWNSIHAALDKGIKSVKINCVIMRGVNDDELVQFVELTKHLPLEVRFIEYMPFGGNKWEFRKMVSFFEMRARLLDHGIELQPIYTPPNSTAKMYSAGTTFLGKVGFISSNTVSFCGSCNRLRLTADGNLKPCLHDNYEVSLRDIIRKNPEDVNLTEKELIEAVSMTISGKKKEHDDSSTKTTNQKQLTHVTSDGNLNMIDVGKKAPSNIREATASCIVTMSRETLDLVEHNQLHKGDVLTVAKIAGIQGAKQTNTLIPLCHQVPLTRIDVQCFLEKPDNGQERINTDEYCVRIVCIVTCVEQRTGVEMEALTGAAVAALTVYDMCKGVDKGMRINHLRVCHKSGGSHQSLPYK